MSTIKLTRTQQQEMKKLGKSVDRATEADRVFFERRSDRMHRVRISHQAEIRQNEIIDGKPVTVQPGFRWFTVVRNVYPGARIRLFVMNLEDAETDLDEATAREIFQWGRTPWVREVEARLRKFDGSQP